MTFKQLWLRLRSRMLAAAAVLVALAAVGLYAYHRSGASAHIRRSVALDSSRGADVSMSKIQKEKSHHQAEAIAHAARAREYKKKSDAVAARLADEGHLTAADLVRRWNQ